MDTKFLKDKRFWFASFLVVWAGALQGTNGKIVIVLLRRLLGVDPVPGGMLWTSGLDYLKHDQWASKLDHVSFKLDLRGMQLPLEGCFLIVNTEGR